MGHSLLISGELANKIKRDVVADPQESYRLSESCKEGCRIIDYILTSEGS